MNTLHPDILALIPPFLDKCDFGIIKPKLSFSNKEYVYFASCGHLNILQLLKNIGIFSADICSSNAAILRPSTYSAVVIK